MDNAQWMAFKWTDSLRTAALVDGKAKTLKSGRQNCACTQLRLR